MGSVRSPAVSSNVAPATAHVDFSLRFELRPHQRDFERGADEQIANQPIGEPVRVRVHRPGDRHTVRLISPAAKVLDRRQHARADDGERQRHGRPQLVCRDRAKPDAIAGLEEKRLGAGWVVGLQRRPADDVPAARCHRRIDPGLPAGDRHRAAGTAVLGDARRGAAIRGSTSAM